MRKRSIKISEASMVRTITSENVYHEIGRFRLASNWKDECTLHDTTATPGIFYHGTNHVNISVFKTDADSGGTLDRYGVFFTQNPTGAAIHSAKMEGNRGLGGRVYRVELVTQNPFFADAENWIAMTGTSGERRDVEAKLCSDLKMRGFDAVVTLAVEGTIFEIIVFDNRTIKRLDDDIGPLCEWSSPDALGTLLFYQSTSRNGPDFAPECTYLVNGDKLARSADASWRRVVVNASSPIFIEQVAWPRMDFDILRYGGIDVLIDPRDGSALVIDPTKIVALNRDMLRELRSKNRRRV